MKAGAIPSARRMKFSVIIPFANAEATLPTCLDSVVAAADRLAAARPACGAEIICVNGGSRDRSAALVAARAAHDGRLVVRAEAPREAGAGAARNRGMDLATGDYLVFVDADDTIAPEALVSLADATADIVTFLPPQGTFDLTRPEGRRATFSPLVGNLLAWNAAYRRAAVAGLRFPNLCNHEDLVWTCGMYARAKTLVGGVWPWYRYDAHVAGSAANSHSGRRVAAAWAATSRMWRAVRPAFAGNGVRLRAVMLRKLAMHLVLHVLAEVPRALAARRGGRP